MVNNAIKCYHFVVETLFALIKGTTSTHKEDFYCLNCFNSNTTKDKLKNHYNVCRNQVCCYLKMLNEDNKILKHINGKKFMKHVFVSYFSLEYIFKKLNPRQNDSTKSYTEKKWHALSGYSFFAHCSFNSKK